MKKLMFFSVFIFLISFVTAVINVAEDNPNVNGVNIFPEKITIISTGINITQNITIINNFDQELNTTKDVTFDDITSTGIISGFFNWIVNLLDGSSAYLTFNGSTLSFNETQLNSTISQIANLSSGGDSNWNVSGNNLFPVDISNFVGIGLTSPTHELNVLGSGNFTGDLIVEGDIILEGGSNIKFNSGSVFVGKIVQSGGRLVIQSQDNRDIRIESDGNPNAFFLEGTTGDITLSSNLFVDGFQTLGTATSGGLSAGDLNSSGMGSFQNITLNNLGIGSKAIIFSQGQSITTGFGNNRFSFNGGPIDINGNWLFLDNNFGIDVFSDNINTTIRIINSDTGHHANLNVSGSISSLGTGNNFFNGNVGIGTTSPNEKLEVVGQLQLTNTTTEFSKIYTNANGDTIFT